MRVITTLVTRNQKFWNKKNGILLLRMLGLLGLAMVIQQVANYYALHVVGVPVGDLILSNIPTVNLDIFIVQGALVVTFVILGLLFWKPKYVLFTLGSVALFLIVRSFFISLTHLGVDPHEIVLDPNDIGFKLYNLLYNSKNDFFFSGHTGLPFLMGLIFMREKLWRNLFFLASFILGVSVLLGHVHYSIDVFAAPFMTYTIYRIAKKIFPQEYSFIDLD